MVCERPPRSLRSRLPLTRGRLTLFSPSVRGRAGEGGSLTHHLESAVQSLPIHKCHSVSGTGVGAIARDVVDFVETLAFRNHRGDDRQPVLDFGCADPEIVFRQSREGILVTTLHRSQNSLIEFLIDYEVRQASGSYERHSLVTIPILDRTAQCMTEGKTTPHRRPVGLVVHVKDDRYARRRHIREDAVVNKTIRVWNSKPR